MIGKKNITSKDSYKYLRSQLKIGGKTLSNLINILPLENGKIFAFVPEGIPEKSLYEFDKGGLYFFDKELLKNTPALVPVQNDARSVLIRNLHEYLDLKKENCCIFEEPIALPSDPFIKNSEIEYVHINDEMFYFFDKKNNDAKKIEKSFTGSEAHYFLCALSTLNFEEHFEFAPFKKITTELLEKVVANLTSFFVRAYDGEGYLMWTMW